MKDGLFYVEWSLIPIFSRAARCIVVGTASYVSESSWASATQTYLCFYVPKEPDEIFF